MFAGLVALALCLAEPTPPVVVGSFPENEAVVVRFDDGTLKIFYNDRGKFVGSLTSDDDGRTWGELKPEFAVVGETAHAIQVLRDRHGELHAFYLVLHRGKKLGVDYFIDLWCCTSTRKGAAWQEPRLVYHGGVGALRGIVQTRSGRIIVPFSTGHPERKAGPPIGNFYTTAVYSDDDGRTWRRSPSELTAPCTDGYNGGNYGAVEPTIVELRDGRLWMLLRTQTGRLYESFSTDGSEWSPAAPSRFYGSNSPAMLRRLIDGRLLLIWNNAQVQPRPPEGGVYSGRDAVHAALSDDDGQTWCGFREIYRDPTRNGSSDLRGDRGTAYSDAVLAADGTVIVVTGQGEGRRAVLRVDPHWLTATTARDEFADGLNEWHGMLEYGPAQRFWRARKPGAVLMQRVERSGIATLLTVGRTEPDPPAGAVWNFPAGHSGRLTLKVRTAAGFGGADVGLTDRLYAPCDDKAIAESMFSLHLPADDPRLEDDWHILECSWSTERQTCDVTLDGRRFATLQPTHRSATFGLSYLCLRSTAKRTDLPGLQVAEVAVAVEP